MAGHGVISAGLPRPVWACGTSRRLRRLQIPTITATAPYNVSDIQSFEHAGIRGAAATATLKPLPGAPARAADLQTLFVLLETPSGRTNVVCLTEKQNFATRKAEFEAVARGLTVPP
jgi:hypothetical protein